MGHSISGGVRDGRTAQLSAPSGRPPVSPAGAGLFASTGSRLPTPAGLSPPGTGLSPSRASRFPTPAGLAPTGAGLSASPGSRLPASRRHQRHGHRVAGL